MTIDYSSGTPKVYLMGEEVPWQDIPAAPAVEIAHHFKTVRLSPRAIDSASKIIPIDFWIKAGIYSFLQARADHVFSKLSSQQREGKFGQLKYFFEFDSDGAVLKNVQFSP